MDAHLQRSLWRLAGLIGGLIAVALLLAAILATGQDPGTIVAIFATRFLGIFIEAAPFLLLGALASGLIEAFLSAEDLARFVPRSRIAATFMGTFLGFTFPVCECGVVPVVRRLYNKGLPLSVGIAFLLAAPVINPIVLASTYVAFGFGPVLIGRFVITALVATTVGLIFAIAARPGDVLAHPALAPVMGGSGTIPPLRQGPTIALDIDPAPARRRGLLPGLRAAIEAAVDDFIDMGRYMIVGTALAAAMQTLVSQETLIALGRGPVVSVWTMQLLAFVLSVCSTVDSFLALAFVGTFTTGSILAFLSFGPMVDIKSTMMFAGVFKKKVVIYLIVLPLLLTMLIGIWTNLNLAI
jgi:uncharacterized membrane protein YraQ (UPF0718 family)